MLEVLYFFIKTFTAISLFFSSLFPGAVADPGKAVEFDVLEYPTEAVKTLDEAGLTEEELKSRASDSGRDVYIEAQGYSDVNGLVVSPYYTADIGDTQLPVYSATVYLGSTHEGELHSFSEIYIEKGEEFSLNLQLESKDLKIRNAICLPESLGVTAVCKGGTMTATIDDFGMYTFLFNEASQKAAYTLFVREKVDEEAEIEKFIAEYGRDNMIVLDKGVHYFDYLSYNFISGVIYLKQGAYVIANHIHDIDSEEDDYGIFEPGAPESNTLHIGRYPFINLSQCTNVKIVGYGAIDLTRLDRRERRGLVFTDCDDVEVRGVKIINPPEWAFITYQSTNVKVKDVDIFGYRQNADAFAICNSQNVTIDNSFCRTGDDLFDVKALGGRMGSNNITFTNCYAWGGKARCFGICGEVCRDITDVTFKDCAVIYRDATWNNDRISSLAIVVEITEGPVTVSDITFENIEIYRDEGRAIGCVVYEEDGTKTPVENCTVKNIVYKDITYVSKLPNKIASNGKTTNTLSASFENVRYRNIKLDKLNRIFFETDEYANLSFAE